MWGCVGGFIEDIDESMNEYFKKSDKVNVREVDQWFLKECIYPVVKEHSFISDEFVNFEGKSVSINRDRKIDNFAFIGEPFDENDIPLDPSHRELIKDYYNRK
jgi:hypothetical protein